MYVPESLIQACRKVQVVDHFLLQVGAREEAISHRLAVYLEPYFSGFQIDCEYNKSEESPKKIFNEPDYTCHNLLRDEHLGVLKKMWFEGSSTGHGIRPDIAVHRRGLTELQHNLLVVECKLGIPSTPTERLHYDWAILRLNEFTSDGQPYTYQYGALVTFQADSMPTVKLFQNRARPINLPVIE